MEIKDLDISEKEKKMLVDAYCMQGYLTGITLYGINERTGETGSFCLDDPVTDVVSVRIAQTKTTSFCVESFFDVTKYNKFFIASDTSFKEIDVSEAIFSLRTHEAYINSPRTREEYENGELRKRFERQRQGRL